MRVILDPGHGGEDPGAVAASVREADMNLRLAFRVAEMLQTFGHWVTLTRWRDVTIPLRSRVLLEARVGCDVFISLHHNASENLAARGLEVWTSVGRTAADALALRILDAAAQVSGLPIRREAGPTGPDKERDFFVLRQTRCPAVLVEAEFLTNPEALAWLGMEANRSALALALARGVNEWTRGVVP